MKFSSIILLCFAFIPASISEPVIPPTPPAIDAREYFAQHFYRLLIVNSTVEDYVYDYDIVSSPLSLQKFIAVVYNGAAQKLGEDLLFSVAIKHVDWDRLIEDTVAETGQRDYGFSMHLLRKQVKDLRVPSRKQDILDFFKNDFNEIRDNIVAKNYILVPADITFPKEFCDFAQNYFETSIVNRDSEAFDELKDKFGILIDDNNNAAFYSEVNMVATLRTAFTNDNGQLTTVASVRYGKDRYSTFIELPLVGENNLSILIVLPDDLDFYATQIIGRTKVHYNDYFGKKLQTEIVDIRLPHLKMQSSNNIFFFIKEKNARVAREAATDNIVFDSANNSIPVDSYWQKVNFELKTSNENALSLESSATKTFDAINKPIFFAIKTDTAVYIMGQLHGKV